MAGIGVNFGSTVLFEEILILLVLIWENLRS